MKPGRPRKQTVEYFPHFVNAGKIITIIEHRFGIKGYAGYYKLLELLGETPGHFYKFDNTESKIYAESKTGLKEEDFLELMKLLIALEEADLDLWEREKIIWLPNFVELLKPLYETRKGGLPLPPGKNKNVISSQENPITDQKTPISSQENPITEVINSQTKLKKGNSRKEGSEGITATHPNNSDSIPFWVNNYQANFPNIDLNISWKKFSLHRKDKGLALNNEAWELWLHRDHENGWNLRKDSKPKIITLYCKKDYKGHPAKDVPKEETYGHFCSECEEQMIKKWEVLHELGIKQKENKDE